MKKILLFLSFMLFVATPAFSTLINSDYETYFADPSGMPAYSVPSGPAYYLWSDDNITRTTWHLRWTSDAPPCSTSFSGNVEIKSGEIDVPDNEFEVAAFKFESGSSGDTFFVWDSTGNMSTVTKSNPTATGVNGLLVSWAGGGQDGLDFTLIGDNRPSFLVFDLSINGNGQIEDQIFIGSLMGNPESNTFKIAAPMPEPGTLLLLGSGMVGMVYLRKRKKA